MSGSGRGRAGRLRERIQLQRVTRVSDGQGGSTETWTTYATVWARVRPLNSAERTVAMQDSDRMTHEVEIRAQLGLRAPDRVVWGLDVLRITGGGVNGDERDRFLTFPAVRVESQQAGPYIAGVGVLESSRTGEAAYLEDA